MWKRGFKAKYWLEHTNIWHDFEKNRTYGEGYRTVGRISAQRVIRHEPPTELGRLRAMR